MSHHLLILKSEAFEQIRHYQGKSLSYFHTKKLAKCVCEFAHDIFKNTFENEKLGLYNKNIEQYQWDKSVDSQAYYRL